MSHTLHDRINASVRRLTVVISNHPDVITGAEWLEAYRHLFLLADCADDAARLEDRLRPLTWREKRRASRVRQMWAGLARTMRRAFGGRPPVTSSASRGQIRAAWRQAIRDSLDPGAGL